jgi:ribonuclease HI
MKQLWRRIGMEEMRDRMCGFDSAQTVVQEIMALKDEQKILISCMLWQWWLQRNKKSREGKEMSVDGVLKQAKFWASESLTYCKRTKEKGGAVPSQRWQKPVGDVLKNNTDGAFQAESGEGGWGFIIHDSCGDARGSGTGKIQHCMSALHAEAMACLQALQAATEWGMVHVQIETDSTILVRALQGTEHDRCPGLLFREMRIFLQLNFFSWSVTHVVRSCNNAAHLLAAIGSNQSEVRLVWPDYVPDDVNVVVASESAEPV